MHRVNHREPAQGTQFVHLVVHMEVGEVALEFFDLLFQALHLIL
ncbi:hypothetical protein LCGC14_0474360 [marine sediment metagenome]|uniref:Uncharacterized protein n=1 Tax=marine sediment metagenome TaxID=412755 RepID=A0A0F9UY37_9ZZZZ